MDWKTCSHYFKLVHMLKERVYEPSIYTHWGHLIHSLVQKTLTDGNAKENATKLIKTWQRFCKFYKFCNDEAYWAIPSAIAIRTINDKLFEKFGKFEVLKTEEKLLLPIEGFLQKFKGYVDLIISLPEENKIIIADIKSCNSTYFFEKYRDKFKDYQLTLYKHFYCQKHNIDPKTVETYFITIERNRRSKKPVSFVRVTSGPKKVKNALEWIYEALGAIDRGTWIKNRANCFKWGDDSPCPFYNTPLCSR